MQPLTDQPDSDHVTWVEPPEYERITASLDEPPVPNERTRAAAKQMAAEQTGCTSWSELRPQVVASGQRVSEARAEMEREIAEDRAYEQAMRARKRGGED